MSILKTYDRPMSLQNEPMAWPFTIIGHEEGYASYAPGEWVTHDTMGGTGMIVALTEDQMTILWSVVPKEIGSFASMAFPLVRRVFPPALAPQLISIQPMTAPVGGIFYMDYQYGDKLNTRCTTGPWWSRLFWRAWRCTSGKTRSWWSSLSAYWASFSTKRSSTSAANDEQLNVDRQKQLLQTMLSKDKLTVDRLVEKWNKALPPPDGGP